MPQNPFRMNVIADSSVGVGNPKIISGTTHTFNVDDLLRYLQFTNGGAITLTVPADADLALPIGAQITIEQTGAGQVTFTAAGGVTLNSAGAKVATAAQFAVASAIKTAANKWTLVGNLA